MNRIEGIVPLLLLVVCTAAGAARTVAVDVGHFLAEPGALSARGRPEFEFNRALGREIAAALKERGIAVRLIGADGRMRRLRDRTAAAVGADLFLSVHHDSVQPRYLRRWSFGAEPRAYSDRFSGFSLFVSRRNPDPARSLGCASAIGAALRRAGFAPSLYHAERIPGESKPFADRRNGVHYDDRLIVLESARQPAVLLEAGVIVNRAEELKLLSPAIRRVLAAAVADGVARCLVPSRARSPPVSPATR